MMESRRRLGALEASGEEELRQLSMSRDLITAHSGGKRSDRESADFYLGLENIYIYIQITSAIDRDVRA